MSQVCLLMLFTKKKICRIFLNSGLPRSGKKFWKMKNFPGQGKVKELHFQSRKFKKMKKVMEKSGNFKKFPKKMLVNRLLEILAIYVQKHSISNIYGLRFFFL